MNRQAAVQTQQAATIKPVASGVLQRKCACGNHIVAGGECESCRKNREAMLQRAAISTPPVGDVPPIVHEVLRSPGQPLDLHTRAFMEPRFGHDFSQVRVHIGAQAAESARAVNALAYTVGRNVVFGAGQYAPQSRVGQHLLAHELTHTLQQMDQSVENSNLPHKFTVGRPTDHLEQAADHIAHQVMTGKPITSPGTASVSGILARVPSGGNTAPMQAQPQTAAPAQTQPPPAPRQVTPRGPNPAACMTSLCSQIARPPRPRTDDELRHRADEWLNGALACVRTGAAASNASHQAEILANNEQELQASHDTFIQDFNALPQAQRDRLRAQEVEWLQDQCRRSQREAQIEFEYNVVFENPAGGLLWGTHPAEWDDVEGALAALPAEATWMNPLLLHFRRSACHPDDVDATGQCTGQGTGLTRSFTGGETDTKTGQITIFTHGLGQTPFSRSTRLGLSSTSQTLRHEVGHVIVSQVPQMAKDDFFKRIMEWRTYPWHWINVRQPIPGAAQELRDARPQLCTELGFTDTSGSCDDTRLDQWLSQIQLDQEVQAGGRTYVRRTGSKGHLQSIRTANLPQDIAFEYARTDQDEYLTELYALAVSRPEFLHSALPPAQITWLKAQVFQTPIHLARKAAIAPDAVQNEFIVRGSRLFTWEQLDALLNQLLFEQRTPGGRLA